MDGAEATDLNSAMQDAIVKRACVGGRGVEIRKLFLFGVKRWP